LAYLRLILFFLPSSSSPFFLPTSKFICKSGLLDFVFRCVFFSSPPEFSVTQALSFLTTTFGSRVPSSLSPSPRNYISPGKPPPPSFSFYDLGCVCECVCFIFHHFTPEYFSPFFNYTLMRYNIQRLPYLISLFLALPPHP